MSHPLLNDAHAKMKKAVDYTLHEFSSIHTGKATPAMVEGVMVEAYGSQMRLKECAAITTPDSAHDPDPAVGRQPHQGDREGHPGRPTSASTRSSTGRSSASRFPT